MTALLPEAPARIGLPEPVSVPAEAVPTRVPCRIKPYVPAFVPPAVRVRALSTRGSSIKLIKGTASTPQTAAAVAAAGAVWISQAANVAFLLARRPSMPRVREHGKFRA